MLTVRHGSETTSFASYIPELFTLRISYAMFFLHLLLLCSALSNAQIESPLTAPQVLGGVASNHASEEGTTACDRAVGVRREKLQRLPRLHGRGRSGSQGDAALASVQVHQLCGSDAGCLEWVGGPEFEGAEEGAENGGP